MAGRPRKPSALKLVEGNRGKRKLPANEPKPRPILPDLPDYLGKAGKSKWNALIDALDYAGIITEVDGDSLGMYCYAYERFRRADERLKHEGRKTKNAAGSPILNPWVTELNTAVESMNKYGAKLGLSPADRTKIEVKKPDDGPSTLAGIMDRSKARRGNGSGRA